MRSHCEVLAAGTQHMHSGGDTIQPIIEREMRQHVARSFCWAVSETPNSQRTVKGGWKVKQNGVEGSGAKL